MIAALAQVDDWPVTTAAAGVVDSSSPQVLGTAGPIDQSLPWASVTKLLTAVAALIAVEEGSISLDEPAGPPGATVRHLLAHASGLPMDGTEPVATPAARRIYSNTGFDLLAETIASKTGMSFCEYLGEAVLGPLGLSGTRLAGSAASSAEGPVNDLLTLGRELLAPTLLTSTTLKEATEVAFPRLAGVLPGFGRQDPNDWGLGFELRDGKHPHWTGDFNSPRTFGHFGRAGGFLWVDPATGLACGALSDRQFGPWAASAWPRLSDAVLAEYGPSR